MKRYWLMKTEPTTFSFDDLMAAPGKKTTWEGVRNYQARNFFRDDFKEGDLVLVYHSNTDEPAAMGTAEVSKAGFPDPFALDSKSKYYDPDAAKKGENPWLMVEVKAVKKFKTPVTRDMLRENKSTKSMMVLAKGSRLSVQPVTETEFKAVVEMGS